MAIRGLGWGEMLCVTTVCLCPLAAEAQRSSLEAQRQQRPVYSARDASGWTVESVIEELRELSPTEVVEPTSLSTRSQALSAARDIALRRSTPALRAFLDTTTRDPQELRGWAATAAINGGEGAMAFLLAAEKRQPGDWPTLYNIAVFLQLEGYPRASLAILDSLRATEDAQGPGGIDLRAALLLARGMALMDLGRPRQAIPLFREAREREPFLVEAARALARAHLLLDEEEEAKKAIRLGGRRFASKQQMRDMQEPPPIIEPVEIPEELLIEAFNERGASPLSLNDRWPLHKGKQMALSPLRPPSSIDDIGAFNEKLGAHTLALNTQYATAVNQVESAAQAFGWDTTTRAFPWLRIQLNNDAIGVWGASADILSCAAGYDETPAPALLAAEESRDAERRFARERLEDEELALAVLRARQSHARVYATATSGYVARQVERLVQLMSACPDTPEATNRRCVCQAQRTVGSDMLSTYNAVYVLFLSRIEQWYRVAHHHSTAVAGYVENDDEVLRRYLRVQIEAEKASVSAALHRDMAVVYAAVVKPCDPETEFSDEDSSAEESPFDFCGAADGMGYKLNLVVYEMKVSCYEIEAEIKTPLPLPLFSSFASGSYTYRGKDAGNVTIFSGLGFGTPDLPGINAGVKSGTYVTFGPDGSLRDGGYRFASEASVGPVSRETSTSVSVREVAQVAGDVATGISNSFLALRGP